MKKLTLLSALLIFGLGYSQSWDYLGSSGFSGDTANYLSLAINSQNQEVYVAYQDMSCSGKLTITKHQEATGTWGQDIDDATPIIQCYSNGYANYIDLNIDDNGFVYLSYIDAGSGDALKLVRQSNNNFYTDGTGSSGGFWGGCSVNTSIKKDYDNNRYLVKYDGRVRFWAEGSQAILTNDINITSLSFDFKYGTGYVAYSNLNDSGKIDIQKVNTTQSIETYDNVSDGLSNYIDLEMSPLTLQPYIAFQDIANGGRITVKKLNQGNWELVGEESFSEGLVNYVDLAFDVNGVPYVAFEDVTMSNKLSVMTFDGNNWGYVGQRGITDASASYCSIELNPDGEIFVAFKDGSVGNKASVMKYGSNTTSNPLTPITDANFNQAIETCLSTNPIDGMCSDSEYGAMPDWDVSQVTDMSYAFQNTSFNGDISQWDVSGVTNMMEMFSANNPNTPSYFNGDISQWDVSNVTNITNMFLYNSQFNGDISQWDVSNVTNMRGVFWGCQFNGDISQWNVTAVNLMDSMFRDSPFNGDISQWDVSNVTSMEFMFNNSQFNGDISQWDVSNVTNMWGMFYQANAFNQPIGDWDVSSVTNMNYMFSNSYTFNQDISNWDVSNVTDMRGVFWGSPFNGDISQWDVSNVTRTGWMFRSSQFNQDISQWDVSSVTDMQSMFYDAAAFNQDISNWDVSNVTDMDDIFNGASAFNQDISNWCVTNIPSEPTNFSIDSPLTESNKPVWGTCPSSPYEWINYGTQDWTVENAEMVTYRDGTPIPQVTGFTEWANLTTGAWCYYDNDPTKGKLYNWYAVMGIHDNDPNTPNKELAPEGWHVPSNAEWLILEEYLVDNGYNYDNTTFAASNCFSNYVLSQNCNKISKAMASTSGWEVSSEYGDTGWDQISNNSSGFNASPLGYRAQSGFLGEGNIAGFWSYTEKFLQNGYAYYRYIYSDYYFLQQDVSLFAKGHSVRFVRDATSLSTTDFSNSITIYPNPVKNMLTIDGLVVQDVVIYSVLGKAVLKMSNQNTIDVSSLSKGVYFIKVSDGINASTKKFIKE